MKRSLVVPHLAAAMVTAAVAIILLGAFASGSSAATKSSACKSFRPVGVAVLVENIRERGTSCKMAGYVATFGIGWALDHRSDLYYLHAGTTAWDNEGTQNWQVTFTSPTGINAVAHAVLYADAGHPNPQTGLDAIAASVTFTISTDAGYTNLIQCR